MTDPLVPLCLKYVCAHYEVVTEGDQHDLSAIRKELLQGLLGGHIDLARLENIGLRLTNFQRGSESWTDGKAILAAVKFLSCQTS